MTDLNLIDKFLLLALDDEKGSFNSGPFALTYGFAGAIFLELSLKECITIIDKKVVVNNFKRIDDTFLNKYLDILKNSKKERSLKYWIQKFGNKERDIKKETLDKLIAKRILAKREQKFLWVFNNDKFPTVNAKPENTLRKRLYEIVELHKKPILEELMLVSLINTCNMDRIVYGKERYKKSKKNIKAIISDAENNMLSTTIKEIHTQITAMIVVIMSASIAATAAAS
ncbi:GPP34 family phosphoprotein [Polaribacter vadi]|uniref:GOLPH3/VPS74 family protein n=1 Tax=Polaribacter TaxID=52959 RepID=UPI001C084C7A|nr:MULTISPECIES: GPP34 family phosphoprotein [Polaribacter]MBU3010706.1 GPP34 family phosphoprotein [Polaribacter vadi]MDO6740517.1 GPP34 family phosphoprotein [Polaribacter sp. 1_MG-2023]